jgi:acyl-CoA synthetase (AMP-forming)/AMP-acid ligase II
MVPSLARTLIDVLEWRAAQGPDRSAYSFDGEVCTYGEMWDGINRFAAHLLRRGLGRGERVVLALPNSAEFFSAFYGIQRAGGVAVPIVPGAGPERLAAIAGLCQARLVALPSSPPKGRPTFRGSPSSTRGLSVVTVSASADCPVPAKLPGIDEDELSYIQYTSGSTGNPKGVQLSHANLITNVNQMIAGMEITEREVFVSWLPVYHDMGLVLMTMVPFYLGARLALLPTSLAHLRRWLEVIQDNAATFTAAPDFAYRLCLRYVRDPESYDLSSLRVALNAAEPVRARTITEFERAFGLRNVMCPGYGLAEATVGVSMGKPGSETKVDERGLVSVGRPFPEVDVKILSGERTAGAGEEGEILVRSPAATRGYLNNPDATAELFWESGYLRTGDLGYLDAAGDLFISGRIKNIIIHAGRNISPQEVEEIVDTLPRVRLSAAVGVDRGRLEGEQVYVFAETREGKATGSTEAENVVVKIVSSLHDRLGLRPGRVYLLKPKSIPLTHNGKKRYGELKKRYMDGSLQATGCILFPEP